MRLEVPIKTSHLFKVLDEKLISLLRSLTPAAWNSPTIAKLWTVKDIAAHLLDGNMRMLSMERDVYVGLQPTDISSYHDLVQYLNALNSGWVTAMKRVSPQLLTGLLEQTGSEFCKLMETADPWKDAVFPVAWAGQQQSPNWFHIAREYTEKWIHQQQIRDAVNKPGLITPELFYPFIDTFMQGLSFTYKNIAAAEGTAVQVTVTGEMGGSWFLVKDPAGWHLTNDPVTHTASQVIINPDTAWRLFSKGITPEVAESNILLLGDAKLGRHVLSLVAVMA